MLKFLTKSLIATALLKRYRKLLISSAVLFVGYFIIGEMHDDFLEYAERSEDAGTVGYSYAIKWIALALVTAVYYWFNTQTIGAGEVPDEKPLRKTNSQSDKIKNQREPDPFEHIRQKEALSSKAELHLHKKNTRSN